MGVAVYGRSEAEWEDLVAEAMRFLGEQARLRRTTTYTELNSVLAQRTGQSRFDFSRDSDRAAMGALLGSTSDQSLSDFGAMISSIVIYLNANDAGSGFYHLAVELGLLPAKPSAAQKEIFWTEQMTKVHEHFARKN